MGSVVALRRSWTRVVIRTLVIVCAGNICRSPMAEALLKQCLKDHPALEQIEVSSAGTIACEGDLPCADSVGEMHKRFGIDINGHRARPVTKQMKADLVLTMDKATTAKAKASGVKAPVEMLGDFAGTGEEVGDPYGGARITYQRAAAQLDRLVDTAIERMVATANADVA